MTDAVRREDTVGEPEVGMTSGFLEAIAGKSAYTVMRRAAEEGLDAGRPQRFRSPKVCRFPRPPLRRHAGRG